MEASNESKILLGFPDNSHMARLSFGQIARESLLSAIDGMALQVHFAYAK